MHDVRYALTSAPDVTLSQDDLSSQPFDSLYFRRDDGPRISLVLSQADGGQQRWLSADAATLVVSAGRVTNTVAFNQELLFVTELERDPLQAGVAQLAEAQPWTRQLDWQASGFQNTEVRSTFVEAAPSVLQHWGLQVPVRVFHEQVTVLSSGQQFQNSYWFAAETGTLLKSRQHLFPGGPVLEFEFISRFNRLVGEPSS